MSSHRRFGAASASAALAAWLACGRSDPATRVAPPASAGAPTAAAAALIVLPGARDVKRSSQGGASAVTYQLGAEFPASGPILEVVKRLGSLGWSPLKEDPLNPGIPTSMVRSWTSYVDARKPARERRYVWASDWEDGQSNRLAYRFAYEGPEHPDAPLRRLTAMAGFYPAELARQIVEHAHRAGEGYARGHPLPPGGEGGGRTVLPARTGDAFLVSGPAGEAVVQITARPGDQAAYRWRFRDAAGREQSGSVPVASRLVAGPFSLGWQPRYPFDGGPDDAGVGFHANAIDLVPVPGQQFDTIDLAGVHALATLMPDRNARYLEAPTPGPETVGNSDRVVALLEGGRMLPLQFGGALLLRGPAGAGVIQIQEPDAQQQLVRYHWRFRPAGSSDETSGDAVATDRPFPLLRVGPYSVQWWMRTVKTVSDEQGKRVTDWTGDVKYLPEEVSVDVILSEQAPRVDLSASAASR